MTVINLEPSSGLEPRTMQEISKAMEQAVRPNNKNINLKTFNDVLDACFLIRASLADLYDADIQVAREEIRQEEKERVQAGLDKISEALIRKEKSLKVDSAATLRTIIKTVSAYDRLSDNKPMSKQEFISYCADLKLSSELAGQIYLARCFDIEARRKLITENIGLLSEE